MGLQINDDARLRRWDGAVQRIGGVLVLIAIGAAAFGLIGGTGVLSETTTTGAAGLMEVRFERFVHRETDESMDIRIDGGAVTNDHVDLELSAEWLEAIDVNGVMPQPAEQIGTRDGILLRVPVEPGASVTVRVTFRANQIGNIGGWARAAGDEVTFTQFSYP